MSGLGSPTSIVQDHYYITITHMNPNNSKRFFSSPKQADSLWIPPSLLFNGYRGSFVRVKWLHHSPPSCGKLWV